MGSLCRWGSFCGVRGPLSVYWVEGRYCFHRKSLRWASNAIRNFFSPRSRNVMLSNKQTNEQVQELKTPVVCYSTIHRNTPPVPTQSAARNPALYDVRRIHDAPGLLGDDSVDHPQQAYLHYQARGKVTTTTLVSTCHNHLLIGSYWTPHDYATWLTKGQERTLLPGLETQNFIQPPLILWPNLID